MINVIFNDLNCEILPKRLETYEKYSKILQWGRANPTRFLEQFMNLEFSDHQKYILLSSWIPSTVVWLCSRSSGKAQSLDTPIYPYLYSDRYRGRVPPNTIGELKIGDFILNESGQPVEVIDLKPIIIDEPYKIIFEDNEEILCNDEHLWDVYEKNVKITVDTLYLFKNYISKDLEVLDFIKGKKKIKKIIKLNKKIPMRCITVNSKTGLYLCGNKGTITHNSFMAAPFMMARALLLPNTNTYIMAPSGSQAQETFSKMENLAKNNIASVLGVSSFFLDETVKLNSGADPFTHSKNSYNVTLYNGSTINTLNSVAKNIVGIRSNFSIYDEAGKIDRDYYSLTLPFSVQDTNFVTGHGINTEIYPLQLPNKNLFLSSAEGIDSQLFDMYKISFEKMMLGDPNYFVADIDCNFSLHPFMNGKPMKPLISQSVIDDAFKTNPYRAQREYFNKFDQDGSQDSLVKRSTINKYSQTYYPIFKNEGGKKYIIAYDPSTKLDNSIIMVAELFRDEEKGLMVKFVNCINLIEILGNGEKMIIQKPEQINRLKQIILDYNLGALDYDNIDKLIIDAGAGGGGTDIAQFLMNDWVGSDGKYHIGWIDTSDAYMSLRADDYPGNSDKLRMFNFKRQKETAYTRVESAINQGLAIFPNPINARNELEFEVQNSDGTTSIRYEKVSLEELGPLVQFDLAKEELVGMEKQKKPNGTLQFNLSAEAKSHNMHDDRADCVAMILDRLMELRAEEALQVTQKESDFKKMFEKALKNSKKTNNPFNKGTNPFLNRKGGSIFR